MTNKEKEKLIFETIKLLSKKQLWKFKSYFIFKVVNDFFYESNFYINSKENRIQVFLAFKPFSIDNVFWDITDLDKNKKMPLSFRAEAAFNITSHIIFKYNFVLDNLENLQKELESILKQIENKIVENSKTITSTEDYLELISNKERIDTVAVLTALIELEKYDEALKKIFDFRNKGLNSGFIFGDKDFYDLAKEYIMKKTKRSFWNTLFQIR